MAPPPGQMAPPHQLTISNVDSRVSGRVTRYVVTPWTASKIALASFAVGVFVGFRLNKTIRRFAAKLLNKIQKDG
ncbi:unnamed protein product [Calypogeia fissa]